MSRLPLSIDAYVEGVRQGDRAVLGRAITLVESNHPDHQAAAQDVLLRLLPHTGQGQRVGITGVPGVGKSTTIDTLGSNLTEEGHRVAVLAIDPTSGVTGGSVLGDKTRMARLSRDPRAFVRPSPSGGSLGGVARKTRETLLICEAAGFDVVLVETVGVGQSETMVAEMVDCFVVLMLANAGDELQGIKRGILELADVLAINKADGENAAAARRAKREYLSALKLMRSTAPGWKTPVVTCSGLMNQGLDVLWEQVQAHRRVLLQHGELDKKRKQQLRRWMWSMVDDTVLRALRAHPAVAAAIPEIEQDVLEGRLTPTSAARRLLEAFGLPALP